MCNSHRNKAFVSSLEDTHLGPMQKLKNGSRVLHIIVEKVNRLIVWLQMIVMLRYKIVKGDYHTEIKLCTIVRRHTLGTNATAQNGS